MWIIIGIAILALFALIDWMCTQVNIVTDAFSANIFTLLAVIAALIGAIYFWASSQAYKDYKIKEKIFKLFEVFKSSTNLNESKPLKRINKFKNSSVELYSNNKKDNAMSTFNQLFNLDDDSNSLSAKSSNHNLQSKKEIDLSTINLQSLIGDLQNALTSPAPIFFKG